MSSIRINKVISISRKLSPTVYLRLNTANYILTCCLLAGIALLGETNIVHAQNRNTDCRSIDNGKKIFSSKYIDQPYILQLPNQSWLCSYTKSDTSEGSADMRIGLSISKDKGSTWMAQNDLDITPSYYQNPFLSSTGRIYIFYTLNDQKAGYIYGGPGPNGRLVFYLIGKMVFKYSDDNGQSWSDRHIIKIPYTHFDSTNQFGGKYQMWWQICKPILGSDGQLYMSFTKNSRGDVHEGWVINSPNINTETDVNKLVFNFLPQGQTLGIRSPTMGGVQEEHNIVQLNNGKFYMVFRTAKGFICSSYSSDNCKTWSQPQPATYTNGDTIRNTRACARIFKCQNGKYLLWFENNSNVSNHRNPAWVSGGIEKNGTIYWSQPEILLYSTNHQVGVGISYPDLVENGGNYYITETEKSIAHIHPIDTVLLNGIWQQALIRVPFTKGLMTDWGNSQINDSIGKIVQFTKQPDNAAPNGITIEFQADKSCLSPGKTLVPILSADNNKLVNIVVRSNGDIGVDVYKGPQFPGEINQSWDCDMSVLAKGSNTISLAIDSRAEVLTYMINGILYKGTPTQLQGWTRLDSLFITSSISSVALTNDAGCLQRLKVFNTALSVSQQIQDFLTFNTLAASIDGMDTTISFRAKQPVITFTGFNGVAPYTFSYSINGDSGKTITTVTGDSVGLVIPTNQPGIFTYTLLRVTDQGGVTENVGGSVTVTINPPPDNYLKVYPNPTTGTANIEFIMPADNSFNIQVIDALGKVCGNTSGNAVKGVNTTQINLSRFTNGLYYIRFIDASKNQRVYKLLKL